IDPLAVAGARTGKLSSGATNFDVPFTVQPSNAAIANVSPGNGGQGSSVQVTVTGTATHWQQGTTSASLSPSGPCASAVVDLVDIQSLTTALLHVTIPANACVGAQTLQVMTGGEVVSSSFSVYASTPSLTLSPSNSKPGTAPKVTFLGEFSHFT